MFAFRLDRNSAPCPLPALMIRPRRKKDQTISLSPFPQMLLVWHDWLMNNSNTVTFEMNGNGYETDKETLEVLRSIVPSAKTANDFSAVIAIMSLGESSGRIRLTGRAA